MSNQIQPRRRANPSGLQVPFQVARHRQESSRKGSLHSAQVHGLRAPARRVLLQPSSPILAQTTSATSNERASKPAADSTAADAPTAAALLPAADANGVQYLRSCSCAFLAAYAS